MKYKLTCAEIGKMKVTDYLELIQNGREEQENRSVHLASEDKIYLEIYFRKIRPALTSLAAYKVVDNEGRASDNELFFLTSSGKPYLQRNIKNEISRLIYIYEKESKFQCCNLDMNRIVGKKKFKTTGCYKTDDCLVSNGPEQGEKCQSLGALNLPKMRDKQRYEIEKARARDILKCEFRRLKTAPTLSRIREVCEKRNWKASYMIIKILSKYDYAISKTNSRKHDDGTGDLINNIENQCWPGLVIVPSGGERGDCVRTRKEFQRGGIVCDYHGIIYPAKVGERLHASCDNNVYSMFFRYNQKSLMIDSNNVPCDCHSHLRSTYGRKINHSSRSPNLHKVPFSYIDSTGSRKITVLFKAKEDIAYDEELFYDYGITSADDGSELPWLNT